MTWKVPNQVQDDAGASGMTDNAHKSADYPFVPDFVVLFAEGFCREFQVVGALAEGGALLHVSLEALFGDGEADDRERGAGRVDDEGVKVGEEAREGVGRAVEGGPPAAGAVEAEAVGAAGFAAGDVEDPGVDETHEADAGRFSGGGSHNVVRSSGDYSIVIYSGDTSTPTDSSPGSSTMRYFFLLPRNFSSLPSKLSSGPPTIRT